MILDRGTKLGPYEIVALLGAGGMGEVYRARDTRLGRTVAIKILQTGITSSDEMRQRFEREARAVSSLNHPYICTLYDIGQQDGVDYLVMEYLEGESLAARLSRGSLPLPEALNFAIQIAAALDHAHRNGIAHRDLKPGNIMLTKSGAKLLDFGLAKLHESGAVVGIETRTLPLTGAGTLLGTLEYMSPEQLEGREADSRSDVFAFGAVMYEMITGQKAFHGTSAATVIAAVLTTNVPAVSSFQPVSPPLLDHLVRHCLEKRPDERWQSARDAMLVLQSMASSEPSAAPIVAASTNRRLFWGVLAILTILIGGVAAALVFRTWSVTPALTLSVLPPAKTVVSSAVISPDGVRLAFVASAGGRSLIWIRRLDSPTANALTGTDGVEDLFWSPDSRYLGFFAHDELKKIQVGSPSPPEKLCAASEPRGGAWGRDGVIVFAPNFGECLYQISASGGTAVRLTSLNSSRQENSHRWPHFLPDGRHVLYFVRSALREQQGIYAASIGGKESRLLLAVDSAVAYAPSGHLLYLRDDSLLAQRFDARAMSLSGEPVSVAEHLRLAENFMPHFSVSDNNILAYQTSAAINRNLIWFDASGKQLESIPAPSDYGDIKLSPDGKRVVGYRVDAQKAGDVWLMDLSRGITTRLTSNPAYDFSPVWSPDGNRIVFASSRDGALNLYVKPLDGVGTEQAILKTEAQKMPTDWSPDGRFLLFESLDSKTNRRSLWIVPYAGGGAPRAFRQTEFDDRQGRFSPDGKWVAWCSNESGKYEVYVQSIPAARDKFQISDGGGSQPEWARDGKALFYFSGDRKLMTVNVTAGAEFHAGRPTALFSPDLPASTPFNEAIYAVSADGKRFLLNVPASDASAEPVTVVIPWNAPK